MPAKRFPVTTAQARTALADYEVEQSCIRLYSSLIVDPFLFSCVKRDIAIDENVIEISPLADVHLILQRAAKRKVK